MKASIENTIEFLNSLSFDWVEVVDVFNRESFRVVVLIVEDNKLELYKQHR